MDFRAVLFKSAMSPLLSRTVKQIEDTYLIVNDTPRKIKNIKLKINYKDEKLMKKIKALKKRKYRLVLRYEFSLRYDLM